MNKNSVIQDIVFAAETGILVSITGVTQHTYGESPHQEEVYCLIVKPKDKRDFIVEVLIALEGFDDARLIQALPLYGSDPISQQKQKDISEEMAEEYCKDADIFSLFSEGGHPNRNVPFFVKTSACFDSFREDYFEAVLDAEAEREHIEDEIWLYQNNQFGRRIR